jgi:hypothetical protein
MSAVRNRDGDDPPGCAMIDESLHGVVGPIEMLEHLAAHDELELLIEVEFVDVCDLEVRIGRDLTGYGDSGARMVDSDESCCLAFAVECGEQVACAAPGVKHRRPLELS